MVGPESVWDAKTYHKFKNNRNYIQTYIDYYLQSSIHYKDRFNYLLEILDHPETRKWFPYYVNKKGNDLGLLDYFFNGTPDVAFSRQVYERYIRVEVRHKIKDFSQFWKLHLEGQETQGQDQGARGYHFHVHDGEAGYLYSASGENL